MTDGGSRLSRWSRMKADARRTNGMRFAVPEEAPDAIAEAALPLAGEDDATRPVQGGGAETAPEVKASEDLASVSAEAGEEDLGLPDIDSLDAGSDYTPFMSHKVSDAIRNRALRKLWRSDPVLACLDGLNDYDEDYTDAAMVVVGMKSDYVVGRGMVDYEAEEAKKRAAENAEKEQAIASADAEGLVDDGNEVPESIEGEVPETAESEIPSGDELSMGTDCKEKETAELDSAVSVDLPRESVPVT